MDNLELFVSELEVKVQKLIDLHKKNEQEKTTLHQKNTELLLTIEKQKNQIEELEEKSQLLKLSKTISGEKNSDVKLKINELVREIDKCIALLNR